MKRRVFLKLVRLNLPGSGGIMSKSGGRTEQYRKMRQVAEESKGKSRKKKGFDEEDILAALQDNPYAESSEKIRRELRDEQYSGGVSPDETANDTPIDTPTGTADGTTSDISTDISVETSSDIPTDISTGTTDGTTDGTASDISTDIPTDTSTGTTSDISTDTSVDTSSDTPTDISTDTPTDIPDERQAFLGQQLGQQMGLRKSGTATGTAKRPSLDKQLTKSSRILLQFLTEKMPLNSYTVIRAIDIYMPLGMSHSSFWRNLKQLETIGVISREKVRVGSFQGLGITIHAKVYKKHFQGKKSGTTIDTSIDTANESANKRGANSTVPTDTPTDTPQHTVSKYFSNEYYFLTKLTDDEIATVWPNIFEEGFRTQHLKQICDRLSKNEKSLDQIKESLNRIEDGCRRGVLRDQRGNRIKNLPAWCVNFLSVHGYCKPCEGYVSAETQEEVQQELEKKKKEEARGVRLEEERKILQKEAELEKERFELDLDKAFEWFHGLSEEERQEVIGRYGGRFDIEGKMSQKFLVIEWRKKAQ